MTRRWAKPQLKNSGQLGLQFDGATEKREVRSNAGAVETTKQVLPKRARKEKFRNNSGRKRKKKRGHYDVPLDVAQKIVRTGKVRGKPVSERTRRLMQGVIAGCRS